MTILASKHYDLTSMSRILKQVVDVINLGPVPDGITASAGEINTLDGITATVTELNKNAGVTAGTVSAGKVVVAGSSKDVDTLDIIAPKINGTALTATAAELNKAHTITAGTAAASKYLLLDSNKAVDALRTASLLLGTSGSEVAVTATAAELNVLHSVSAGQAAASSAVVLDSNKSLDVVRTPSLRLGASGSETAVAATAAEINATCDQSAREVAIAVSTSIAQATHGDKTVVLGGAGSARTMTLPAATGSGARFRFVVGAVNTSNYVIQVTTDDVMYGNILAVSTAETPDLLQPWTTAADSDTITLNGTTKGGVKIGDWVECEDIATDCWAVRGVVTASGTEVTPFSAAVS